MAITFTAANVRPCDGYPIHTRRANAAATITPGQPAYLNSSGDLDLAANTSAALSEARGVILSDGGGSVSFPAATRVDYVTHGPVAGFAGMTPGSPVYVSTAGVYSHTAGSTGTYNYIVGYAESATVLFVNPQIVVPIVV